MRFRTLVTLCPFEGVGSSLIKSDSNTFGPQVPEEPVLPKQVVGVVANIRENETAALPQEQTVDSG